MDQVLRQVLLTLKGMWQRRWIGLAAAWVVAIVGAAIVVNIPDRYEATARIYVDTQSVLKPLMAGLAVPTNTGQQITMLSRTLISRTNVEKLARMAELDLATRSKEQQEALIDRLMSSLQIRSGGRDNIYTLSYRDTVPDTSKRVVQSLVSIFVESGLGGKRQDSDSAKRFIDEQIKQYETKLTEAEERLKEFKLRNIDIANVEGKDYYGRMSEATAALAQARLSLREAEVSREALKRQLLDEPPVLAHGTLPPTMAEPLEVDPRLHELRRNLDQLRLKYTEEHPDVVGAKRVIAALEEQRKKDLASRKPPTAAQGDPSAPSSSTAPNPVYQQLKVSLGEVESVVASLQTRVAEYEARVARLKASAKLAPQLEAELVQLNRDYDVHRRNYQSLVSRRESAEISGDMQASSNVADFRLIDPPRVSPKPVAPNRVLLFFVVILASLGAGLFASMLANHLRPTFLDMRSLREVTGLPVLGSVSMLVSDDLRRRERRGLIGWIMGSLTLAGSLIAGLSALFLLSTRVA
jgi:polysaccharide chain length determinant protein (PEP-CTERM system associated)